MSGPAASQDVPVPPSTPAAAPSAAPGFRALVEHSWDAIALLEADGTIRYASPAVQRILGYTPEEMVGLQAVQFFHPEDLERVQPALAELAEEPGSTFTSELRFLRRDGTWRWIEAIGTNLLHDDQVDAIIANFRDIEERKLAEQELARRTVALEQSEQIKDEFLATLAHELRNPLAAIRTAIHVLESGSCDNAGSARLHTLIARQTDQLTHLVNDLLDLARITRGSIPLVLEPVDLRGVIEEAIEVCRLPLDARGHTLTVRLPHEPACVRGDRTRLQQIVCNLLENAGRYTDPGGSITVTLKVEAEHAVLDLEDNGTGMSPELLERIFDAFTRGETGVDRTNSGLGIGLTIVRRLVEMQGGTISASSPGRGMGSRFQITFPLLEPGAMIARPPETALPIPKQPGCRILLVEDNIDAAESMRIVLESWGHTVHVVGNGLEALEQVASVAPQVILCDIGLPGMDGYEVARRLRQDPIAAGVRIVAISGYGRPEDRRLSQEAGFDRHLVKPVNLAELSEVLSLNPPAHQEPATGI